MEKDAKLEAHLAYMKKVLGGEYPDNVVVPLDKPFVNQNGEIQNIVLGNFTSSALIHSTAKSIRANHYHREDWHFAYLISGEVWYYHRPHSEEDSTVDLMDPSGSHHTVIKPGQLFFTPPMVEHAMAFPTDSVFITFSKRMRDHESHEEDVRRVKLIDEKVFKDLSGTPTDISDAYVDLIRAIKDAQ